MAATKKGHANSSEHFPLPVRYKGTWRKETADLKMTNDDEREAVQLQNIFGKESLLSFEMQKTTWVDILRQFLGPNDSGS